MSHSREADATLRGFHYQFLKTIEIIIDSKDGEAITVEGIVEDIDIVSKDTIEAVQCKYLESSKNFTLSLIYKPVLQMMEHYSRNSKYNIKYRLYIYLGGDTPPRSLTVSQIDELMSTKNQDFLPLVKNISPDFKKADFCSRLSIESGISIDKLQALVKQRLPEIGINSELIDELYFPNTITYIGELSRKPLESDRVITKKALLLFLESNRSLLYSKWALLTQEKRQLLAIIKKQLSSSLGANNRTRYIVIGSKNASIHTNSIDIIASFVGKYSYKPRIHTNEPIFFFEVSEEEYQETLNEMERHKTLSFISCEMYKNFSDQCARKKSIYDKSKNSRDFFFKIARLTEKSSNYIENESINDLFLISCLYRPKKIAAGVQVYELNLENSNETKYALGVRDTYE